MHTHETWKSEQIFKIAFFNQLAKDSKYRVHKSKFGSGGFSVGDYYDPITKKKINTGKFEVVAYSDFGRIHARFEDTYWDDVICEGKQEVDNEWRAEDDYDTYADLLERVLKVSKQ